MLALHFLPSQSFIEYDKTVGDLWFSVYTQYTHGKRLSSLSYFLITFCIHDKHNKSRTCSRLCSRNVDAAVKIRCELQSTVYQILNLPNMQNSFD